MGGASGNSLMQIHSVHSDNDIEMVRSLFGEYEDFLQVDLSFQRFDAERSQLPGRYAPPDGDLLIAMIGKEPAGCVAMRKIEPRVCEMKRLFVRPEFWGRGLGMRLALEIIKRAKHAGYETMFLDTLNHLEAAMRLYARVGFRQRPPYYQNPLPEVIYWELNLVNFTTLFY